MNIEATLVELNKSKFRASFRLKKDDIDHIQEKGWKTIQAHCFDFISKRLAPAEITNDGKQTPTHGHPVFKAQHACACCCRSCLYKWHKIKKGIIISNNEIKEIVELLMTWMHKEFDSFKETASMKTTESIKTNKPIQLKLFS